MRIGFSRLDGRIYADATIEAENLAEFQKELQGDDQLAIALIEDDHSEKEDRAMAAFEGIVWMDSGEGTVCRVFENLMAQAYAAGEAAGEAKTVAKLDGWMRELVERILQEKRGTPTE